jgi:hypothetical protein
VSEKLFSNSFESGRIFLNFPFILTQSGNRGLFKAVIKFWLEMATLVQGRRGDEEGRSRKGAEQQQQRHRAGGTAQRLPTDGRQVGISTMLRMINARLALY